MILLEGRMEFEVDGTCHEIGAGDSIHFRAVRPHAFRRRPHEREVREERDGDARHVQRLGGDLVPLDREQEHDREEEAVERDRRDAGDELGFVVGEPGQVPRGDLGQDDVDRARVLAFRLASQGLAEAGMDPLAALGRWGVQDSPPGAAAAHSN